MNNLQWFLGNDELLKADVDMVAGMDIDQITEGIEAIGVEPEVNVPDLAQEIRDLAQKATTE